MDTLKLIRIYSLMEMRKETCVIHPSHLQQVMVVWTSAQINPSQWKMHGVIELWRVCKSAQTPQMCELFSACSFNSDCDNFFVKFHAEGDCQSFDLSIYENRDH